MGLRLRTWLLILQLGGLSLMTKFSYLMFRSSYWVYCHPYSTQYCLIKSFQNMNIPLFVKKCISYLRNVLSQRCHMYMYLSKFCLMYFFVPRRMGPIDLYYILRGYINESVSHYHFKMDSLSTIIKLVNSPKIVMWLLLTWRMPIILSPFDLLRQCLHFTCICDRELYEFTCPPNGLSSAPRIFTKILKPPLSTLHKQRHIFTYKGKPMRRVLNVRHYCPAW